MKILFIGDESYEVYALAFYHAAQKMKGIKAEFFGMGRLGSVRSETHILDRVQHHYRTGPGLVSLNRKLLRKCARNKYDILFFYSCALIFASTLGKLKSMGHYIAVYCNDDPFSGEYKKYFWRHFRQGIRFSSIAYSYRKSNIRDYRAYGAERVKLLRSYYIDSRNYYMEDEKIDMFVPQVIFLGHYENDGRLGYMKALTKKGITVGLNRSWKTHMGSDRNVWYLSDRQEDYNRILNKALIAIVFLSKRNHDTYTRRCFEIPAVRTLMIAPYNEDMAAMFTDGKEAVLYTDIKDFAEKVRYFMQHEHERRKIAEAGYRRVRDGHHEASDRVRQVIADYEHCGKEQRQQKMSTAARSSDGRR